MRKQYHILLKITVNLSTKTLLWYKALAFPWEGRFFMLEQVKKTPCCTALLAHVYAKHLGVSSEREYRALTLSGLILKTTLRIRSEPMAVWAEKVCALQI